MSAAGRQSFSKNIFPGDDSIAGSAPNQLAAPRVVGLRPKQHVFSALPLACRGFLTAVFIDVFLMASYSTILLATGISSSAFYFAALILSTCVTLVYFSISAIRSENTVELLAAIGISSCVNATVIYFRANENAFSAVKRRDVGTTSMSTMLPPELLNAGILTCTALLQLALMWCGYLSYQDFGWRIFKLFGIDFNMRQVYERFLWFMAMLKVCTERSGTCDRAIFIPFAFPSSFPQHKLSADAFIAVYSHSSTP